VRAHGPVWRKALAFLGPGYLVAVGYMDPGNWATSLAGGSRFGYTLLFAALISSLMAIVLQSLCARLAVATDRDLAQACRDAYPRPVSFGLWLLAELAIVATDLAEVIGTAIGLKLLSAFRSRSASSSPRSTFSSCSTYRTRAFAGSRPSSSRCWR
jgi:manganese transport protein